MATTSWSLLKKIRRTSPSDFLQVAAGRSPCPSPSTSPGCSPAPSPLQRRHTVGTGLSASSGNYGIDDDDVMGETRPPVTSIAKKNKSNSLTVDSMGMITGLGPVSMTSQANNNLVCPVARQPPPGQKNCLTVEVPMLPIKATINKMNTTQGPLSVNPYCQRVHSSQIDHKQLLGMNDQSRLTEIQEERKKFANQMREKAQKEEARITSKDRKVMLNSVIRMDVIKNKSASEIQQLWTECNKDQACIFSVIQGVEYEHILARACGYGTFLYPLPRQDGYEFIVQQFEGNHIHFTPLIAVQTLHEDAAVCLTITHYTELMEDKGIVLMRGQFDSKVINVYEAQLLALQVRMYYGLRSGPRFNLVQLMVNSPDEFKHIDLIEELENLSNSSSDRDTRDAHNPIHV